MAKSDDKPFVHLDSDSIGRAVRMVNTKTIMDTTRAIGSTIQGELPEGGKVTTFRNVNRQQKAVGIVRISTLDITPQELQATTGLITRAVLKQGLKMDKN